MDLAAVNYRGHFSQMAFTNHSAHTLPDKVAVEGYSDPARKNNSYSPQKLLSEEASYLSRQGVKENSQSAGEQDDNKVEEEQTKIFDPNQATSPSGQPLSESEQQQVEELKRRDAEVKAHEQAHLAAAGNLAQGSVNFDYETGPDGNRYAVGGDVSIDTSEVAGDPRATLLKAQRIRRAASAPVDPSPQDRAVAAEAARMEANARLELSEQSRAKQQQYIDENSPEVDFFSARIIQSEKDIQDTYKKIQNASVLEQQKNFVDFFI